MRVEQRSIPQERRDPKTNTFYTAQVLRWVIVEDGGAIWRGDPQFPFYAAFPFKAEAEAYLKTLT
jgi:hypothetical protein